MELLARLTDALSSLAFAVGDAEMLAGHLSSLVGTLTEAVSGLAAVRLTLMHAGHPVHVGAAVPGDAEEVVTSLRLPLPLVSPELEVGGRLVVWSTVAGSLVDLAADLDYVFGPAMVGRPHPPDTGERVSLDLDLSGHPVVTGVEGLTELATINRAVGRLIEQGYDPDSALDLLRRDAAAAGLSTQALAAQVLRRH